jgi:hypothetical protein
LAAESSGYLLLAVTDHVAAAPRAVSADEVELMPDGNVRLRARRAVASDVGVEQVLRQLLARTLEVSSSVGPALRRAAQRTEDAGLPALVRELETALIPVNRSAAKRALSRLYRETERAKSSGKLASLVEAEAAHARVAAAQASAPVAASPIAAPEVVAVPIVEAVADSIALAADYPEPSPVALPVAASLPAVVTSPARPAPKPMVHSVPELTLTPEPRVAVGEPAFTKPEPVVQRAKERGSSTPRLGTLVTLQTLPGEEAQLLTERAPAVIDDEDSELDLSIDVELEPEAETPQPLVAASVAQPLVDPEPSRLPDVLTAMVELHAGVGADEAPTRIRDVVTELRVAPAPVVVERDPSPIAELTPSPVAELTPSPVVELTPLPVELTPSPAAPVVELAELTPALAAPAVELAELTPVPLAPVIELVELAEAPRLFESEQADPALHEALTWNPGPVAEAQLQPLPPALLIAEPEPELSPYAPAVLPSRQSDVSELLDSFYVSDAAEERELRSALKGMAGLDLTPMPHPHVRDVKEG